MIMQAKKQERKKRKKKRRTIFPVTSYRTVVPRKTGREVTICNNKQKPEGAVLVLLLEGPPRRGLISYLFPLLPPSFYYYFFLRSIALLTLRAELLSLCGDGSINSTHSLLLVGDGNIRAPRRRAEGTP